MAGYVGQSKRSVPALGLGIIGYIYIHDSIYKGSKYKPYRTGIYHIYIVQTKSSGKCFFLVAIGVRCD